MTGSQFGLGPVPSPVFVSRTVIPSASVLTMFTTPVPLIAGVSGRVIIPITVTFELIYGGTAYAALALNVEYANMIGTSISSVTSTFLAKTASNIALVSFTTTAGIPIANLIGSGMVLTATLNPTLGNSNLVVQVLYSLLTP